MSKSVIVSKINSKREELAKDIEVAAELWIKQGCNQKLLNLGKEMDKLFNEYYQVPKKLNQFIPKVDYNASSLKENVSLWIKTIKKDGKKVYECWVKEFGNTTKIGEYFKRTSKWSGSGAQDCGISYIQKKYPNIDNIKLVDMDLIKDKYSTSWKKIKNQK